MELDYQLLSITGFVFFIFSFIYWKQSVIFLMYWILIVGVLRKWVLPDYHKELFFTPQFMLSGVYMRFFVEKMMRREPLIKPNFLNTFIITLFAWCLLEVFNPHIPDIRVGIIGLITYFYFLPLGFIIPEVFQTKEDLIRFFKNYVFVSIPVFILGIIQFLYAPADPINVSYGGKEAPPVREYEGPRPRISSVFPFLSYLVTYITFTFLIATFLISLRRGKRALLTNFILALVLVLITVNSLMTGSRTAVILLTSFSLTYLLLLLLTTTGYATRPIAIFGLLFVVFIIIITVSVEMKGLLAAANKIMGHPDLPERIETSLNPFQRYEKTLSLAGYGIGLTYQGSRKFIENIRDPEIYYLATYNEEEPERVLIEVGLIGYLLVFLIRLIIIIQLYRLFITLHDRDLRLIALVGVLFQIQFMHMLNLTFNIFASIYYYFMFGFLFLLPKLDKKE